MSCSCVCVESCGCFLFVVTGSFGHAVFGIYLKFLGNPKLLQTQHTYFYVGFPEEKRKWVDLTYAIFGEGGMVNVHFNTILQEKMFR